MSNYLPIIAIFIGGVMALTGYRLFLDVLRLWALLIVGAFGAYISTFFAPAPNPFQVTLPLALGFFIAGILGAVFAQPLKGVILFLSGAMLGILLGTAGLALISQPPNLIVAMALAVVFGLLAVKFDEIVLIISTSFVGSAMIYYGISQVLPLNPIIYALIFFIVGFFGAAAQYRDAGHR